MILHPYANYGNLCNIFIAENIFGSDLPGNLPFHFKSGIIAWPGYRECQIGLPAGAGVLNDHIHHDTGLSYGRENFSCDSRLIRNLF